MIINLSADQLRAAASIQERIDGLEIQKRKILEGGTVESSEMPREGHGIPKQRRKMSASARAKIAAAQRARWAKVRAGKK